jgi:redox-sensitive bicupin YhaK (pirin superfamily)
VAPLPVESPVHIHQNVRIYWGQLGQNESLALPLSAERYGWLQLISGVLTAKDDTIRPGDAIAISREEALLVKTSSEGAEFLLFDLA